MHETRAPSIVTSITRADGSASLSKGTPTDPGANATSYKLAIWFVKPVYALKAIAVALFSYVLVPAWVSLLWVARVLLFRPAVLIYLLFLERPFQAVISLFMWILPLLSFAIATTIFGTLIGGTFGWLSAVAVGFVKAPAGSSDSRGITWSAQPPGAAVVTKSQSQASLGVTGQFKPEEVAAEGTMIADSARSSHRPEMWTRRRRSRNVYATATTTPT
ncbi:hypothetical protein GGH94_000785 [Coemansia aciculifera]|uniref:Uncharacterized protein n=1 Tax=Coemansia aciculifera TaxID=417176 RepID=A0A9W8IVH1_9FUNG|nr:hypothetical protein GGH94_000785 [Coemansia aciculifera]